MNLRTNDILPRYEKLIYHRETLRTYGTLLKLDILGYQHVVPMGLFAFGFSLANLKFADNQVVGIVIQSAAVHKLPNWTKTLSAADKIK